MKSPKLPDKFLLVRLKSNDPEAFAQVYDIYAERIYRFVYFKTSSHEQAEDLAADVFLRAWQYITSGHEVENLNALLYKTARNLVIDHYRRRSNTDVSIDREDVMELSDHRQTELLSKIHIDSEMERVQTILHKLKTEYREVIILRYLDELSISEIADILERTKGSVRVLIHRALKVVRSLLNESEKKEK
ncbi:hypothetical protein CL622_05075 [archaeon]|nr:hypothetical protein [archaeon]|tara:strand:- start:725 stop:1294 length:570 start_codon:yes stop_codon:yes gene_type:complete